MRSWRICVLVSCVSCSSVSTLTNLGSGDPNSTTTKSSGSGATWAFDQSSGALTGSTTYGKLHWTVGKVNGALHFDGATNYVEQSPFAVDTQQSFSSTAWVKLDSTATDGVIASQDSASGNSAFQLGYAAAGPAGPACFFFALASADASQAAITLRAPFSPVADNWYHLVAVYNATNKTGSLYVNGALAVEANVGAVVASAGASAVGRGQTNGQPAALWSGYIDEVQIVSGAWSNTSVEASFNAADATTPVRPPAIPLIVRDPYVNVWTPSTQAAGTWPTFWNNIIKAITIMARVDGAPYMLVGYMADSNAATQLQLEVTATQTRYVYGVNGVNIYLDFISPAELNDLHRLAEPFGFITARAVSVDGKSHATSLYFDITGEWAHGDINAPITWSLSTIGAGVLNLNAFSVVPASPNNLVETSDFANWGTAIWATAKDSSLTWQAGPSVTVRTQWASGVPLSDTVDGNMPRAISDNWPVFAYSTDLGNVSAVATPTRTLVLGNVRQPAVSYLGTAVQPLWQSYWSSWQNMVADAFQDAASGAMLSRADSFDSTTNEAAVAVGGPHYAALCDLAVRQTLGGLELANTSQNPWIFLKENSSGGAISTVDVIYPAMPMLLWGNPTLLRYLLTPVLAYAESGHWPQPFAPHDLGAFPNAAGHNDGGGENMPVEESANMILMTSAYFAASQDANAPSFVAQHYAQLKSWGAYLEANALDPNLQNQTDDFTGYIAHSSNLALKGILGLGALARIASRMGNNADAQHYATVAQNYMTQWQSMSQDSTEPHLRLAYDQDHTWSLKYNAYLDRLLGMGLIPATVVANETAWYATQGAAYGIPLDIRHTYTKADWEMWTAAATTNGALRQQIINSIYLFAHTTPNRVPFTDWYDTVAGTASGGFVARPVMGGLFSILTLSAPPL